MMRQIGKQILTLAAILVLAGPAPAQSVVNTIVTDPLTGVALDGYDPVTYFIEPVPRPGSPDHVAYWGGVPWYFASAANRDVFARSPEIYAPQHGGYCEMSLARGFLSDGKPQFYVVDRMKLYLFYSAANREAFLLSPDASFLSGVALPVDLHRPVLGDGTPAAELVPLPLRLGGAVHVAEPLQAERDVRGPLMRRSRHQLGHTGDAGEHEQAVEAGVLCSLDVGVEPVAHHQGARAAHPPASLLEQRRKRLPGHQRLPAGEPCDSLDQDTTFALDASPTNPC